MLLTLKAAAVRSRIPAGPVQQLLNTVQPQAPQAVLPSGLRTQNSIFSRKHRKRRYLGVIA